MKSGAGSPDKFSEGNRTPPLYSAGIASHKNTIPFITWKRTCKLLKKLDIRRYELVIAIWRSIGKKARGEVSYIDKSYTG